MDKNGWPESPDEVLALLRDRAKYDDLERFNRAWLFEFFGSEEAFEQWRKKNGVFKATVFELWIEPDFDEQIRIQEAELIYARQRAADDEARIRKRLETLRKRKTESQARKMETWKAESMNDEKPRK